MEIGKIGHNENSVFYPISELFVIFIKLKIVVSKLFQLGGV